MTDLRQAAQQALHELDSLLHALLLGIPFYRKYGVRVSNAITALRTALEQQQAEPVAWIAEVELSVFARTPKEKTTVEIWKKPIFDSDVAIYTTPPQRPWVGLTDEEVKHEWEVWRANLPRYVGFAKGIEAKLKERNND